MNNNINNSIYKSEMLLREILQPSTEFSKSCSLKRELAKAMSQTELSLREGLQSSLIEPFDGIRKNNSRKIFGILLIIIIIDFAMDIVL